jgi:hypothetical protein
VAPRRLVKRATYEHVRRLLADAGHEVLRRQQASVDRALRLHGVTALTAAGKPRTGAAQGRITASGAWNQAEWQSNVGDVVGQAAQDAADLAMADAVETVVQAAVAVMADPSGGIVNAIVGRANSIGEALGGRVNNAALTPDPLAAIADALGAAPQIIESQLGLAANTVATMTSDELAQWVVSQDAPTYLSATKTWNTVGDDKVRPDHEDAEGQEVAINEMFSVGGEDMVGPGDPDASDGNVVNCRCVAPETTVSAAVLAAARRSFEGQLLRLTTTFGHQLTATADHPVLTNWGWVPLGSLHPGDQVWRDRASQPMDRRVPDVEHVVASVEQVFDALVLAGGRSQRVRSLTVDLDGTASNEQVDVVRTHDGLAVYVDAALAQPTRESSLAFSHREVGATSDRAPGCLVAQAQTVGVGAPTRLDPGRTEPYPHGVAVDPEASRHRQLAGPVRVGAHDGGVVDREVTMSTLPVELETSGVTDGADLDPGSTEMLVDGVRVAPEIGGDPLGGLTSTVAPDYVADLRSVEFHGYVYDLTCSSGWFFANGIVLHNCWVTYDGMVPEGYEAPAYAGEGAVLPGEAEAGPTAALDVGGEAA